MRRSHIFLTAVLGLLGVLAVVPAFAETDEVQVTIPFQFTVGSQILPAGRYVIHPVDLYDPSLMVIHNVRTADEAIFLTEQVNRQPTDRRTDVSFRQVDGKDCLTRIWMTGYDFDYRVLSAPHVANLKLAQSEASHR